MRVISLPQVRCFFSLLSGNSSDSSSASNEYDGSVSMSTDSFWKIAAKVSEMSKLSSWLDSWPVRGFCIATGQHSSFCGCAGDLVLGGFDHMEDDDQDRGDEEI